jgi:hypothetical protein
VRGNQNKIAAAQQADITAAGIDATEEKISGVCVMLTQHAA